MTPELSLIVPCYQEAAELPHSIPSLARAFSTAGIPYELILVDNGSTDGTGPVIESLCAHGYSIRPVTVPRNRGFGGGVIAGLPKAEGSWVGYLAADGQTAPEDVLRVFEAVRGTPEGHLAKVRRIRRSEGLLRKLGSAVYRFLYRVLFGKVSPDINGTPKIMRREDLLRISPRCEGDFIDGEILFKARRLGMVIVEVPISSQPRAAGVSKVGARFFSHAWSTARDLIQYRIQNGRV